MRKNLLIIFGVIFLIVILALGMYAFKISNIPVDPSPTKEIKEVTEEEKSASTSAAQKAEEIKKKIGAGEIDNETLQTLETLEEDCNEEAKKYSEEVLSGAAKTAEGKVLEINGSKLKIEFTQGTYRWTSEVITDANTTISIVNNSNDIQKTSFSTITIGDRLVVNSKDNKVVDSNFTAESIFILQ